MSTAKKLSPPTAQEYAKAFYAMEDRIDRVKRLTWIADYLVSLLDDDIRAERKPSQHLAIIAGYAASEAKIVADEADTAFLERFNDLVEKENEAAGFGGGSAQIIGEARA